MSNVEDLHIALNKYIAPLLNNNGFEGPYEKNYAYEYHCYFIRKNMAINYWCEIGNDLPRLSISFYKDQIDSSIKEHYYRNYEYLDLDPQSEILQIYKQCQIRIEPMIKDYIENFNKPIGKEYGKKLVDDYQRFGQNELNNIVMTTGEFLRKNIGLLKKENTKEIMKEFKKISRANKIKRLVKKFGKG